MPVTAVSGGGGGCPTNSHFPLCHNNTEKTDDDAHLESRRRSESSLSTPRKSPRWGNMLGSFDDGGFCVLVGGFSLVICTHSLIRVHAVDFSPVLGEIWANVFGVIRGFLW